MAKKLMTVALIAIAAIFAGCEKDLMIEGWDNGKIDPKPDTTRHEFVYTLTTDHVESSVFERTISDKHIATLLKDSDIVEDQYYTGKHVLTANAPTVKRTYAEQLQNKTLAYADGGFDLAGVAKLSADIKLVSCDSVKFKENGKLYCHKNFLLEGGLARLTTCNWTISTLKIGEVGPERLAAVIVVKSDNNETYEMNASILVSEDDVKTIEYSDAVIKTSTSAEVTKTIKINGQVTETSAIPVAIAAGLECGEVIETNDVRPLAYGANANVTDKKAAIDMNIVSFTADVTMTDSVQFVDEGETHTAKVVYNTLYVTSNGDIKVEDNSAENVDIMNTAYFKLVCDNIDMAEDTKQIHQSKTNVRTVEYSDATVKTATSVEVTKTVKVNEEVTETSTISVAIAAGLECGDVIETNDLRTLAYGKNATVANGQAAISMNIVSFTAIVTMPTSVQFVDEGATHTAKVVYNSLFVTSNGSIQVDNNSNSNIDIMNTASFKLVCDNIDMASDTKQVHQTKRIYAEFVEESNGSVIIVLHKDDDVRFTAPSGISLTAGADQEFEVENLELSHIGKNEGAWAPTGTNTVGNVKFTTYSRTDSYGYTNNVTNTVTVNKNDNYVVLYNGNEYPVQMAEVVVSGAAPVKGNTTTVGDFKVCGFTLNYTAVRNNTSASDETVITLKKRVANPTIDGYRLVRADQTDRYNSSRTHWESTPICAWFESTTDKNNTLFVAYDETTGAEIYRENTTGKTLPAGDKLAMVYINGSYVGGHVVIEPNVYIYYAFTGDYTAVSAVSTTTAKLRDPYQGSGVYNTEDETTTFSLENGSKLILK